MLPITSGVETGKRLMSDNLDVLGLLRKYENMDKLKKQAADEIERLRKAGDALAHGIRTGKWDDALDAWTELRDE
jgi:hypothetical protein